MLKQINTQPTEEMQAYEANKQARVNADTTNMYTSAYVEPIPGEFTVTIDGQLDLDYYDALEDRKLRQARIDAAKHVGAVLGHSFAATMKATGSFCLNVMEQFAEAGRDKQVTQ